MQDVYLASPVTQGKSTPRFSLKSLSLLKIQSGFSRGNYAVAVPMNPRSFNDLGAFYVVSGLLLQFVNALIAFSLGWPFFAAGVGCLVIGGFGISILQASCVELPRDAQSSNWTFDRYGFTTRCGVWRPIVIVAYVLMYLPLVPGLIAGWAALWLLVFP